MNSEYLLEAFDASHYSKFNVLYQDAFGKTMSAPEFKRRFDTGSAGFEFVGFIAILRNTGEAVGFYGVFPLKIKVGQTVLPAAVSGDTMTHTAHRKKGLFGRLATMTYEKCKELGIVLIYGFPNHQSYHGLVHTLGWHHVNDMNDWNLTLRFKISPIPKILKFASFLLPIYTRYRHRILKKYSIFNINSFNNSNGDKYGIVFRDSEFITYKKSNERLFIKIEGVVIWLRLSDVLWVGDFNDLDKVSKPVISKLKRLARLLGYNTIRFAVNREIMLPKAMLEFKAWKPIPICLLYLNEELKSHPFLFTAADFDTW